MRCEEIESLLDLLVDGEMPEEMRARVERHLLRCPTCSFTARTLERTVAELREAVAPETASAEFRARTEARLRAAFAEHLSSRQAPNDQQRILPFAR